MRKHFFFFSLSFPLLYPFPLVVCQNPKSYNPSCSLFFRCDKNMPGVVMAMARFNRPAIMIYGGTIMASFSHILRKRINISTCYEAHGAWTYNTLQQPDDDGGDTSATKDEILTDIEQHACPGAGACGGMYTANTMAASIETLGLALPGSSSTPATSPSKMRECVRAAEAIKICMERNIRPRDIMTRASFENALVITMALGGSTSKHKLLLFSKAKLVNKNPRRCSTPPRHGRRSRSRPPNRRLPARQRQNSLYCRPRTSRSLFYERSLRDWRHPSRSKALDRSWSPQRFSANSNRQNTCAKRRILAFSFPRPNHDSSS